MTTNNAVNSPLSGTTGTGEFVGANSPQIATPEIISSINDTNGNELIGLIGDDNSVNYFTITNGATNVSPTISVLGSDTFVNMNLHLKGGGLYLGDSTKTVGGALFFTDAVGTNAIGFQSPVSLSANTTWTLPSADGTPLSNLQTNGNGILSFAAGPQAWALIDGSTGAILAGANVASCTVNGGGNYTITFTIAFSSANYSAFCIECGSSSGLAIPSCRVQETTSIQSQFTIDGSGTNIGQFAFAAFGTLT